MESMYNEKATLLQGMGHIAAAAEQAAVDLGKWNEGLAIGPYRPLAP